MLLLREASMFSLKAVLTKPGQTVSTWILAPQFQAGGLPEGVHGELTARISGTEGQGNVSGNARNIDDGAAAFFLHRGNDGLHASDHAEKIGFEQFAAGGHIHFSGGVVQADP